MKVLVTTYRTAGDRIALAAIRALAERGASVFLAGDDMSAPSFRSRHIVETVRVTSPIESVEQHAEEVLVAASKYDVDVILPTDDYAVFALSKCGLPHDSRLRSTVPPLDAFLRTKDKFECGTFARSVGLHVPQMISANSSEDAVKFSSKVGFPVVLKINKGNGAAGLCVATKQAEIEEYYRNQDEHFDDMFDFRRIVAQEYVPGETHDLCAVFRKGRVVAAITSKRVLTYPVTGGSGILVESTHRSDILELGCKILSEMSWNGPANVEFKVDKSDTPRFIEINGRLWGGLALSAHAGVNAAYTCCLPDKELEPYRPFSYEAGVRFRWVLPYFFFLLADGSLNEAFKTLLLPKPMCKSEINRDDLSPTWAQLRKMGKLVRSRHVGLSPLDLGSVSPSNS